MRPPAARCRPSLGPNPRLDQKGLLIAIAGHVAVVVTLVYRTQSLADPVPPPPIFVTLVRPGSAEAQLAAPGPNLTPLRPRPAPPTASTQIDRRFERLPEYALPASAPVATPAVGAPAPVDSPPEFESTPVGMTAAPAEAAPAVPTALPGSQDEVRQYIAAVMRELNRHKKYPRDLKKAKVEGTVIIRFTIDRSGRLIESSVQQSSGHAGLDQAAMDMLTGAAPLPSIPEFMNRDELALAVPVDYSLITDR